MTVRIVGSKKLRIVRTTIPRDCTQAAREGASVFISSATASRIEEESLSSLSASKETMGLLYGFPFSYGGRPMVRVSGSVCLPTVASSIHVSVDHGGELPAGAGVQEGSVVVGWYHSHTGVGNFMSGTDEATHGRWFSSPHAVSIVFDAVEKSMAAYRMEDGKIVRVGLAIYRG